MKILVWDGKDDLSLKREQEQILLMPKNMFNFYTVLYSILDTDQLFYIYGALAEQFIWDRNVRLCLRNQNAYL